jgi:tetratricopeptide (TPR) repeat protein
VLFSFKKAIAIVTLGVLCAAGAFAQAQKNWKDRAEYDLYDSILKEQNANTKLGLLQQWKEKYPASDYKDVRGQLIVQTYQALGKGKEMLESAKDLVSGDPKNFFGLYWINLLTVSLNDTSPAALEAGEKAATGLLGIMDQTFDPSKRQASVSEDAWKKERAVTESIAHKTLGWVAMQRQKYEDAEKEFVTTLTKNPNDAQASLWAGTVIARQRKLEKQGAALFHFARAGNFDGAGALPQQARDAVRASFEKNYVNFHGDKGGLEEVVAAAKANALPPEGLKIESKDEILLKQEEELKKTNPTLALWISIKRELSGANGPAYFDGSLKNSQIPGGVEVGGQKIEKLKGKVVSTKPASKPKEIVVGVSSPDMSEVTLRFETPLTVASVPVGTELEFSGVPVEYTADPFNLVFEVEPKDVAGLPKAAAPAKKAAPKKAGKK